MHSTIRLHRAVLLAALLVPAAVFAAAAWWNRGDVLDAGQESVQRSVAVMHEHAAKVFDTASLVLGRVDDRIARLGWDEISAPATSALLEDLVSQLDQVVSIWVTDRNGQVQAGSQDWDRATDLSTRDFFAPHANGHIGTFVSRAFTGRATGIASFALSRRRSVPGGGFDGTIHVSLGPDYFAGFYADAVPPFAQVATLFRADGAILAQHPTGRELQLQQDAPLLRAISHASEAGMFFAPSPPDGATNLFAYRQVIGYPVYVSVIASEHAMLARWRANLRIYGAVAAIAALTLLAVASMALRRAQAEEAALRQARHEAEQRVAAEEKLRQSQKMEALGQLTGGIAHDFNNHLAVVLGSLQLLRRRLPQENPDITRFAEAATEGAQRAARLTQRLLAFARRQPLSPRPLDINQLVSGMTEMLRRTLGERVAVTTTLAPGLWPTRADESQLENALLNLAVNARDAMPHGGELAVTTRNVLADDGDQDQILLSVSDTGIGMPPDVLRRALEPFFTTKAAGLGTGLGLAQVYGCVTQLGGRVEIDSTEDVGTTVSLYLPRYHGAVAAAATPGKLPHGHGELVLVTEDDTDVRRTLCASLEELGYRPLEAQDATAALLALRERKDIAVLFTDLVMPGKTGRQLAAEAQALRPGLRILFTTGYPRDNAAAPQLDSSAQVLLKPFTLDTLAAAMEAVLAQQAVEPD